MRAPSGLTLIELTVALVIVGLLFSAAVIGVGALTGSQAKAALGEIGSVLRSLYDTASLSGKTCRLVFELGDEKHEEPMQYRAECAAGAVTPGRETSEPEEKDRSRSLPSANAAPSLEDIAAREKDRVEAAAKYSAFTSPEVQPRKLSGVKVSVWTQGDSKPATHGTAYLYFFPQGYTQRAQLTVEQGSNAWTLQVSPLTGKTTVVAGALEPPR